MKVLNTKYKIELKEAISELESGKIITIPTDTFYGLACDATNGEVINNLFELKERGKDKPVPLLIADSEDLYKYNPQVDGIGKLISKFCKKITLRGFEVLNLNQEIKILKHLQNF